MGYKLETHYKWGKKNLRRYSLTLNKTTNKEEYEHLEKQPNKREYLLNLIREDIKKAH